MFGDDPNDLPQTGEGFLPYVWEGDLYEVYHRNGEITRAYAIYDRMASHSTQIELSDIPIELLHKLQDRINLKR